MAQDWAQKSPATTLQGTPKKTAHRPSYSRFFGWFSRFSRQSRTVWRTRREEAKRKMKGWHNTALTPARRVGGGAAMLRASDAGEVARDDGHRPATLAPQRCQAAKKSTQCRQPTADKPTPLGATSSTTSDTARAARSPTPTSSPQAERQTGDARPATSEGQPAATGSDDTPKKRDQHPRHDNATPRLLRMTCKITQNAAPHHQNVCTAPSAANRVITLGGQRNGGKRKSGARQVVLPSSNPRTPRF